MKRVMAVLAVSAVVVGCKQEVNAQAPAGPVPTSEEHAPAKPAGASAPAEQAVAGPEVDPKQVARCAAQVNSVTRLACYDALAMAAGLAPRSEPVADAAAGKWRLSKDIDPLNDKAVFFAMLDAETGKGKYGGRIGLIVRCKDNRTELYINWASYLGGDTTLVTHRVDKEEAVSSRWGLSTDSKATFFPGSPVPTLKRLAESTSFVANVTPYNESPITAVFNTTGAGEALADLRKACNW